MDWNQWVSLIAIVFCLVLFATTTAFEAGKKAGIRAAGFTAGLLAGLEWAYSQDTLCCHVYGTPTDAVSKAIAHVKATGALPGEAGT